MPEAYLSSKNSVMAIIIAAKAIINE